MTIVYVPEIPSIRVKNGKIYEYYNTIIPHLSKEFNQHDGNIVCIWAFPTFPDTVHSEKTICDYIQKNIKNENTLLFFDNTQEGHILGSLYGIYEILDKINFDTTKCYFFSSSADAFQLHDAFCVENDVKNKINIRVLNVWERHIAKHFPRNSNFDYDVSQLRKKLFLSFNRMSRHHRIALLGLLYQHNLVDKGYISFFTDLYGKSLKKVADGLLSFVSEETYNTILNQILANYHKFPLKLNTDSVVDNVNYVKSDDDIFYRNSYFSVVTETFFFESKRWGGKKMFDEDGIFFSEKTYKPIACKHPFVLLNRPHALKFLKNQGYKTFHPFIDESYDSILDDEARLLAIVNEIKRLSTFSDEQWYDWMKNIHPIIEHNHHTLLSKDKMSHELFRFDI